MSLTRHVTAFVSAALLTAFALGCSQLAEREQVLRGFPVDDLEGLLTTTGVALDREVTHDGKGSLRIATADSVVVALYEVDDLDLDDALLNYRALVRTEAVEGDAYVQMHVRLPGRGEYMVGAVASPLSGTTDWTGQRTGFLLRKGQNPDRVRLNLVVTGPGTVWIDDILLTRGQLPE
jgi:hypothetical protein